MVSRKEKTNFLIFIFLNLSIISIINIILQELKYTQFINQDYTMIGIALALILLLIVRSNYTDFKFKSIALSAKELGYLTPVWQIIFKEFHQTNPKFSLLKYGKEAGTYSLPLTYSLNKIYFLSIIPPRENVLVLSRNKIFLSNAFEEISYLAAGIKLVSTTADEKIICEIISRKKKIPWYKIYTPWGLEKYLKEKGGYI